MIPFGNETVTLIQRIEQVGPDGRTRVSYRRSTLTGCSWRQQNSWMQSDMNYIRTNTITCRIPADQARPAPGDCLFLGEILEEIGTSMELEAALERYRAGGAFRVETVSDNARPGAPLPHWAARGG